MVAVSGAAVVDTVAMAVAGEDVAALAAAPFLSVDPVGLKSHRDALSGGVLWPLSGHWVGSIPTRRRALRDGALRLGHGDALRNVIYYNGFDRCQGW